MASLTTAGLAVGSHSITGVYSGDANFATSTSAAVTQTVTKAATATAITSDAPDPSNVGQAYTVQWSVTVSAPGAGTPTGNVTVSDGTVNCSGGRRGRDLCLDVDDAGCEDPDRDLRGGHELRDQCGHERSHRERGGADVDGGGSDRGLEPVGVR